METYFQLQQHHRLQGRLSEGNRDPTWFSFQIGIFFIQEPLVSLLILILSYSCLSSHNNLLYSGVGRRPGVDPLDGGERLLGGLRPLETGDGLSRGGKVTFIFRQKMSHSVWRDTWIAGYIDQVTNTFKSWRWGWSRIETWKCFGFPENSSWTLTESVWQILNLEKNDFFHQ